MTKIALVIHPQLSYYAGGELLCLYVCKALQDLDYKVTIACDVFNPPDAERIYGLGRVLEKCQHKKIDLFRPAFPFLISLQRVPYAIRMRTLFNKTNADIVFSTQSSSFYIPHGNLYHFVYNILDLFNHPPGSNLAGPENPNNPAKAVYYSLLRQLRKWVWDRYSPRPKLFFAVGSMVLRDLREKGYENSRMIFPPCRTGFRPSLPKKKQVVQFTRILPNKRIELFSEIARLLPEVPFYLIGRSPSELDENLEYSQKVLTNLPRNVTFVNALTRERPDLLQSSQVYLYTGAEAGIGVALVEAISAGCIPISPRGVGAADVIEAAGIGQLFSTPKEAAEIIRSILETDQTLDKSYEISRKASLFGPEIFEEEIKKLAS